MGDIIEDRNYYGRFCRGRQRKTRQAWNGKVERLWLERCISGRRNGHGERRDTRFRGS